MGRKPKFKPVITRVKLNPDQAVLTCDCYTTGNTVHGTVVNVGGFYGNVCCFGKSVCHKWLAHGGGTEAAPLYGGFNISS